MSTGHTVRDRFEQARYELRPRDALIAVAVIAALGFTLAFLQAPLAHDAFHDFRHAAGITCH